MDGFERLARLNIQEDIEEVEIPCRIRNADTPTRAHRRAAPTTPSASPPTPSAPTATNPRCRTAFAPIADNIRAAKSSKPQPNDDFSERTGRSLAVVRGPNLA